MGIRRRLQHSGDHGQIANTRGDTSSLLPVSEGRTLLPQGVAGPMLPKEAGYADAKSLSDNKNNGTARDHIYSTDPRAGASSWDNPSENYAMGSITHDLGA